MTMLPPRPQFLRVLGLVLISGLCLWMILDSSRSQIRRVRLNEARSKGLLVTLPAPEAKELEAQFNALARQMGVHEIIRLNAPLEKGHLTVWITSPTENMRELTGTDSGNAVYDATLDAVFIDRALVKPDDLFSLYSNSSYSAVMSFNDAPFLRTLLHFVFAHELAHRKHHRVSAGSFDSGWSWTSLPWLGTIARKRELEADRLAFEALMRLYSRREGLWVSLFPHRSAAIYDIPVEELADTRQAASLELASAFLMASTSQFFTGTPFGGYHEDSAHPNIFSRMNLLLSNLSNMVPAADHPVEGLGALKLVVERLSRPPTIPVAEVIAPWPIGMAGGSQEELRVAGAENQEVIAIPWELLRRRARRHESERIEVRMRPRPRLEPPGLRKVASPDGFLYAMSEAGRERSLPRGFPLPQPGDYVASEPQRSDNRVQLEVTDAAGTRKCVSSLMDPNGSDPATLELGRGVATPRAMYIELVSTGMRQEGARVANTRSWLRVDPRNCQASRVTYRVPGNIQSRWREGLWSFILARGLERPIWVGPLDPQGSTGWGVWFLGEAGSRNPIVTVPSLYREKPGTPAWIRRFFEWTLAEVGPLSENGIFVNVGNEGIFALTFEDSTTSVRLLWPVGDEVFTVIPIANGAVIFFAKGGRKCYAAFPFEEAL